MSAPVLGVLLAGGRGARLGAGVPKALATLAGRTLLARAHAVLAVVCDAVVVVAPVALALPVAPGERVDDPPGDAGPLAALVAGLGARPHARALALGVDLPLVQPAALAALGAGLGDAPALVPAPDGVPQPLAAWYAPAAHAPLAAALAAGERSLTRAVLALGPRLVDAAALARLPGGSAAFLNVNTPADLAEAARRLAGGRAA